MSRKVKLFTYDWFATIETGEEYSQIALLDLRIKDITYHQSKGSGDKHYCDVFYNGGIIIRFFNLNQVQFTGEKQNEN